MAGQSDKHKSSQAGRTPFYGRPPHQEESPAGQDILLRMPTDRIPRQFLYLQATRKTSTTCPPTSPLQRYNQEKSKEKGYLYQLVEISGATARYMERHSKVVLEMKAVLCRMRPTAMMNRQGVEEVLLYYYYFVVSK